MPEQGGEQGIAKWFTNPALAGPVSEKLRRRWSPQQIAGWLKVTHTDNQQMQVSHESIYRTLFVQSRGALRRELTHPVRPSAPPEGRRCSSPSWFPATTRKRSSTRFATLGAVLDIFERVRGHPRRRRQHVTARCDRLRDITQQRPAFRYLSLSRNFGKESAMLAGLSQARGDAVAIIDADLQHPPPLLAEMLALLDVGYDQVVARRTRTGDPAAHACLALYYRMINRLIDVELEDGVGDFRVLSRTAVDALLALGETNRFSKGLFAWIGFRHRRGRLPERRPRGRRAPSGACATCSTTASTASSPSTTGRCGCPSTSAP